MRMIWQTTRFHLNLSSPKIMGIVNVTPDSFSDGGQDANLQAVINRAECLLKEGAHILDVGGESSRPGAAPVPLEEELARVLPVLRELVTWGIPISIDTYKSNVMQAALDLGVDVVNDIWALRQSGAEEVVSAHGQCGVCLMHMHREPQSMQAEPLVGDAIEPVRTFLAARIQVLRERGVAAQRIVLDPGIGFGKTVAQNFSLLAQQSDLLSLGYPVLAGWSRKSSLGQVTGTTDSPSQDRLAASVAAAVLAVDRGARVVRVHDVHATVHALKVWQAVVSQSPAGQTLPTD